MELLNDWGTTNSTVGELVDILKSHMLLAAAGVLLPGGTCRNKGTVTVASVSPVRTIKHNYPMMS